MHIHFPIGSRVLVDYVVLFGYQTKRLSILSHQVTPQWRVYYIQDVYSNHDICGIISQELYEIAFANHCVTILFRWGSMCLKCPPPSPPRLDPP